MHFNYKSLVVVGTFFACKNIFSFFLGIFLNYFLKNCFKIAECRFFKTLNVLRNKSQYML